MWADIRDKCDALGLVAAGFKSWVDWVDETGGDPPQKAVDLVLRLTADAASDINGRFCWIDDPLQAPIASWDDAYGRATLGQVTLPGRPAAAPADRHHPGTLSLPAGE